MKRLRKITISGFRGIRNSVSLNLGNRFSSLLIFGGNAKGKSCIADGVEWFYKGSLDELSKEGCSRVDYRHRLLGEDEIAEVSLEFSNKALNSTFSLPSSLRLAHSNDTQEFEEYLAQSKKELKILRHSDLKTFVMQTKSQKREKVSELIGLENWESIRADITAVGNRLNTLVSDETRRRNARRSEVVQLIGAESYSIEKCWEFAENQSKVLGISDTISSLKDLRGVDDKAKAESGQTEREKRLAQLDSVAKTLVHFQQVDLDIKPIDQFADSYNSNCKDPEVVVWHLISRLLREGKRVIDSHLWEENTCPLCRTSIDRDELLSHIKDHLSKGKDLEKVTKEHSRIQTEALSVLSELDNSLDTLESLKTESIEELPQLLQAVTETRAFFSTASSVVKSDLHHNASIDLSSLKLPDRLADISSKATSLLKSVVKVREELKPTDLEKTRIDAFQKLSNLSSHLAAIEEIDKSLAPIEIQAYSIERLSLAFIKLRRKTMGEVLEAISKDVSTYFIQLHPDEGFDDIRLKFLPQDDGIEFHIYFKGEEITPPRKFLSESYLSGLGVCLFLATVRRFNRENGFIVLDDIINSFDADHRSHMASLLVNEFADYQLLVLTHDPAWFDFFRRLTTSGWQHRRIRSWSYEDGLEIDQSSDSDLADCRQALDDNDINRATIRVRIFIENRLKLIAEKLGVRMRFRQGRFNEVRGSSELLSEIRRHLNSRNLFQYIHERPFTELTASTFFVNLGSHDNPPEPSPLTIGDIRYALDRILEIEEEFRCSECSKPVWTFASQQFELRCDCGQLKFD